jgi:uncharacterized SAM-binding protein YcdF (DUF218 family)
MAISVREQFIILVDNEALKVSDAIILLEGDGTARVKRAAQLYHRKLANTIVFSGGIINLQYGSYPKEYILPELKKYGVPENVIVFENKSQNTREQAVEVLAMADNRNWKRLLLVASHYHQYRAFLTFLSVLKERNSDIEVINAPVRDLSWFSQEPWGSRIALAEKEFQKIEEYKGYGHIASFEEAIEYQRWKETHR